MLELNITKTCSIENCEKAATSRGWCDKHYRRWKRQGDPTKVRVAGICGVQGCSRKYKGYGWCWLHLRRWKATGNPLQTATPAAPDRFWARVEKTATCWIWQGSTQNSGYGVLRVDQKNQTAHRYSFFLHNGRWPEPMCLHSCDVRRCVNPYHLREGSSQDNVDDMIGRDRNAKGSKAGTAKLDESQVKEIRERIAKGETNSRLSQMFHISRSVVSSIKYGNCWKHV